MLFVNVAFLIFFIYFSTIVKTCDFGCEGNVSTPSRPCNVAIEGHEQKPGFDVSSEV